jgi:hypothetical protein
VWLLVGVVKAIAGAAAWFVLMRAAAPAARGGLSPASDLLLLTVFVSAGLALVAGARDGPPRALGTVFVLFGSSVFAEPLLVLVAATTPGSSLALRLLYAASPVALCPAFFWRFAWDFPRAQPGLFAPSAERATWRISYYTGLTLFVALVLHASIVSTAPSEWAGITLRDVMWLTLVILSMPTVVLLLAKLRTALPEERRRLRLFIGGILLGCAPLFLDILANTFIPAYRVWAADPSHRLMLAKILAGAILLLPLTTAYAVIVDRVLETRFIVRIAIQYAFARYSVLVATAIPVLILASYLYQERHRSLADIVGAVPPMVWAAMLSAAVLIGWLRRPILRAIDRRFFREHYDAREILVNLTDSTRRATSLEQIVSLVSDEIDRAFHAEDVAVLLRRNEAFVDPLNRVAPLQGSTALAILIGGAASPLDVETWDPQSPLVRLPQSEREWLDNAHARLIVPLLDRGGVLVALMTLGDKRSEAPYSLEDRELLRVVAAATATALDQQLRQASPVSLLAAQGVDAIGLGDDPGRECPRCQLLLKSSAEICQSCGGPLSVAPIPKTLCGKFSVERRIGSGGMGLVYLARDTSLRRLVAVKTLHRLSPQESRRLRREARALATLQHENLEIIYAVETWRGSPMLVLEYLAGGTLAYRLRTGPLGISEAASLGVKMAEALHSLHRAGVLHCDVKPSNVGFTVEGIPKLLDFGLAATVIRYDAALTPYALPSDSTTHTGTFGLHTHAAGPAGTLMYMSPEAIEGAVPDVSFDLWSLAVTLYEALAGFNPFAARDRLGTIEKIKGKGAPDLSTHRPECPQGVSKFLSRALSADIRQRPATAREFGALLSRVLAESTPLAPSTQSDGVHL